MPKNMPYFIELSAIPLNIHILSSAYGGVPLPMEAFWDKFRISYFYYHQTVFESLDAHL